MAGSTGSGTRWARSRCPTWSPPWRSRPCRSPAPRSAWLFILRAGYRHADIRFAPILAAYAVGAALNGVLPANLGSVVMLFMFVAIIPGATFPGVLAAFVVEKIFFSVMGVLVYVYLFATVPGSFSLELGGLRSHPWLTA